MAWTILTGVGFNPFRQQKRRSSDYVMVVACFIVVALLLGWVLFPR
jgi:multisubunit Na+/H+ antiporter MnhB subunit